MSADPAARDPRRPEFASRVPLEGGVRHRRAAVECCDWLLAELRDPASAAAPGSGSATDTRSGTDRP